MRLIHQACSRAKRESLCGENRPLLNFWSDRDGVKRTTQPRQVTCPVCIVTRDRVLELGLATITGKRGGFFSLNEGVDRVAGRCFGPGHNLSLTAMFQEIYRQQGIVDAVYRDNPLLQGIPRPK